MGARVIVKVFNILTREIEAHEITGHRQSHKVEGPVPDDAPTFCRWTENGFEAHRFDIAIKFEREALRAFQSACGVPE
jgi:hypothetical protein